MDLSVEEENFYRIQKIIFDTIPNDLTSFFKKKWKEKEQIEWEDSTENGDKLFNVISKNFRIKYQDQQLQIKSGKSAEWDISCLIVVIFNSGLNISSEKRYIKNLVELRTKRCHSRGAKVSQEDKRKYFKEAKDAYKYLNFPTSEIESIENGKITTEEMKVLDRKSQADKRAALRENQENLCTVPKKVKTFTGREEEIEELCSKLSSQDVNPEKNFFHIQGGPCVGKTSLAIMLGHEVYEKLDYNYVIWINMRDLADNKYPNIETVALVILQEFGIDTGDMKDDIVLQLNTKLESITATNKKALLIFDNADALLDSEASDSLRELQRLIDNNSRGTIYAVFTTRHINAQEDTFEKIKVNVFNEENSKKFLNAELSNPKVEQRDDVIARLTKACHGLPYALKITVSVVNENVNLDILKDYLEDLEQNPVSTLSDDDKKMVPLFLTSLKYLNPKEQGLLEMLAVFPSSFSYASVKKFASLFNAKARHLDSLQRHGLVREDREMYIMHPFLAEILKESKWDSLKRKKYEEAYYNLFVNRLFEIASESLKKDKYRDYLEEFMREKNNFQFVVEEIGNGCIDTRRKEIFSQLVNRKSPDYISSLLFLIDLLPSKMVTNFFGGCEKYASGELKLVIRCCAYDVSIKYFGKAEVTPPDVTDEYGRALLQKRNMSQNIRNFSFLHCTEKLYREYCDSIDQAVTVARQMENQQMKSYFEHKFLKLKTRLVKKYDNQIRNQENEVTELHQEALTICQETFGNNWLTVDCYGQLAKTYWKYGKNDEAMKAFGEAEEVCEKMNVTRNKKFHSIVLDIGRFLADTNFTGRQADGLSMIKEVLYACSDAADIKFWCMGMRSLLSHDTERYKKRVMDKFLSYKTPNRYLLSLLTYGFDLQMKVLRIEFDESIGLKRGEEIVKDVQTAIGHLEKMIDEDESEPIIFRYRWLVHLANKCRPLITLSKRQEFANKAIELKEKHSFIKDMKTYWLEKVANGNTDGVDEELLRRMDYLDFIAKEMAEQGLCEELRERCLLLLKGSSRSQVLWSLILGKCARIDVSIYDEYIPYLLSQSEPCEELLELALKVFFHELNIYKEDVDYSEIMKKSLKAISFLKKAVEYLNYLQESSANENDRFTKTIGMWSKQLALKTDHVLTKDDCKPFAKQALEKAYRFPDIIKNQKEKRCLEMIAGDRFSKSYQEQDKERQITMFAKRSQFIRQFTGGQDRLESEYKQFLDNCFSFHNVQVNMVKLIIMNKHVPTTKYMEFIRYLRNGFTDIRSLAAGVYEFLIRILPILLSFESSHRECFVLTKMAYEKLASRTRPLRNDVSKRFQLLLILALKIDPDFFPCDERRRFACDAKTLLQNWPNETCQDNANRRLLFNELDAV